MTLLKNKKKNKTLSKQITNNGFKLGEWVYVSDWGPVYDLHTAKKWCKTEIPSYSDKGFFIRGIFKDNLTQKGTINKREPRIRIGETRDYKNFKYEIVEIFKHPNAGESYGKDDWGKYTENDLLVIASKEGCYVIINSDGISRLTPEQFADEKFNSLIESNLGKYDYDNLPDNLDKFPKEIVSKMYDRDDRVLFGSSFTRGLVTYYYLEGRFTKKGKPLFLGSSVLYDGEGNENLPEDAKMTTWKELKVIFPDRTFEG